MLSVVLVSLLAFGHGLVEGPWSDCSVSPAVRAHALLRNMTLEEKLRMLHGPESSLTNECEGDAACAYTGNVAPNVRLGIPPINMNDGPQGFRHKLHPGSSTAWPSGLAVAASWDREAARRWGRGTGREFRAKGANVQLGPGLNVERVPWGGRSYEYMSGEDPYLGYALAQPVVRGIQSQGIMATAKHWLLNNQETNPQTISEVADERTRFEIYYPPFMGAIEADVASFMCSYNKVDGKWSCENPDTLAGDLKRVLGFEGFVMSDWGGDHSTSIMAGLDMEMSGAAYMNEARIMAGLHAGNITIDSVNDSVFRILKSMFAVGIMDAPSDAWDWRRLAQNVTTQESADTARYISAVSTVLLRNEGDVLPLHIGKKFALIGFASGNAIIHGAASGGVIPSYVVSPLDGIRAAAGEDSEVIFDDGTDIEASAALASSVDYAIIFVGTLSDTNPDESQRNDRVSLSLDDGCDIDRSGFTPDEHQCQGNTHNQDALIEAVASANERTIVVVSGPGAILMPWSRHTAAVLMNFFPGQQAGNAIADVLFGNVNPSGRLPVTIPNRENETNISAAQWPGLPVEDPQVALFSEKLLVGYRYYDTHGIQFTTGFPFGHGLSYTTFEYSGLTISGSNVSFSVTNVGAKVGAEVSQLYLSFPSSAGEPPAQLKGFWKTRELAPGDSEAVSISLADRDLSVWDAVAHAWARVEGLFMVWVGASSRDVRLEGQIMSPPSQPIVVII